MRLELGYLRRLLEPLGFALVRSSEVTGQSWFSRASRTLEGLFEWISFSYVGREFNYIVASGGPAVISKGFPCKGLVLMDAFLDIADDKLRAFSVVETQSQVLKFQQRALYTLPKLLDAQTASQGPRLIDETRYAIQLVDKSLYAESLVLRNPKEWYEGQEESLKSRATEIVALPSMCSLQTLKLYYKVASCIILKTHPELMNSDRLESMMPFASSYNYETRWVLEILVDKLISN